MKRFAILGSVAVGGMAVALTAQGLPGIEGIEQVSGDVYKIQGSGGNTVAFVRSNDVVLVDTKVPGQGEAILAQLRTVTDKPVGMIINTHSHPDHIGSNAFFADNDGVEVVAQANTAARMRAGGGPMQPARVDHTFTTTRTIGEGDDRIELRWFGAGHTDGDAFVIFPSERTMMAGDIYAWPMSTLIDPGSGGSMLALPTTLTAAYYSIDGVDTVITGHGPYVPWEDFRSFVQFNRGLVATAEQTMQQGGDEKAALAALSGNPSFAKYLGTDVLPGLEYGGSPKSRALINLMVAFQELRGEEPQLIMGLPREEWPE